MTKFVLVKVLLAVCLVMCICQISEGQVTFSRDWNAGKRSAASLVEIQAIDCSGALHTITSLANSILKNVHQLAFCESKPMFRSYRGSEEQPDSMFAAPPNSRM